MCNFGDIRDVSDSCDGKSDFVIVESSYAISPLSKNILHMSLRSSCIELQSVMHQATIQPTMQPTKHPTPIKVRANSLS